MENAQKNEAKIYQQLAKIMAGAKAIGKDSVNKQQGFTFRGIDAVMNHLHPVFVKHGVIVLPEVMGERSEERKTRQGSNLIYRILTIRFHFVAEDGSEVVTTVIGEGMDSGDKGANKAMAVGLKYALTQMLLLPYDEIDPDAETHPPSVPAKKLDKPADKKPDKPKKTWLEVAEEMREGIGNEAFDRIIGEAGFEIAGEIKDKQVMATVYQAMKDEAIRQANEKLKG